MFAVVKIIKEDKSLFGKLKYFFHKPLPQLTRINVGQHAYFYYLVIHSRQTGEGDSEIKNLLGNCALRVIPCDKYVFSDRSLVKCVKISGYCEQLLINTALEILASRGFDINKKRICLVDKYGKYADILDKLRPYASQLCVVTDIPESYTDACDSILNEWGLSVVLKSEIGTFDNYDLIISPDFSLNKIFNNTVISRNGQTGLYDVFKGGDIKLPDSIAEVMPAGANKLEFSYALYNYCRAEAAGKLTFSDFKAIQSVK